MAAITAMANPEAGYLFQCNKSQYFGHGSSFFVSSEFKYGCKMETIISVRCIRGQQALDAIRMVLTFILLACERIE